jgi:hypothetical protein
MNVLLSMLLLLHSVDQPWPLLLCMPACLQGIGMNMMVYDVAKPRKLNTATSI